MFGFPSTILATNGTSAREVPHQSSVMTMTLRVAPRRSSAFVSSDVMVVASRALTKRALLADIWSMYCASVMPCSKRSFVTTTAISSGASSAVRLHYGATWRIAHAIESGLRDAAAGGRRPRGHPANARAVRPRRSDGFRHHLARPAPPSHELLDVALSRGHLLSAEPAYQA